MIRHYHTDQHNVKIQDLTPLSTTIYAIYANRPGQGRPRDAVELNLTVRACIVKIVRIRNGTDTF